MLKIKALFISLFIVLFASFIWALSTFNFSANTSTPTISPVSIFPIPEITASSDYPIKYVKPEVKTEKMPIIVEEPVREETEKTTPAETPIETLSTEMAWANAKMEEYQVFADPRTEWHFGPLPENCPADACVIRQYVQETGEIISINLYMKPTHLSEYLLFHEIAHTLGIIDECEADDFAYKVLGTRAGQGYYNCTK